MRSSRSVEDQADPGHHFNRQMDAFVDVLSKQTGVSRRFLEKARPALAEVFAKVPVERREQWLENMHTDADSEKNPLAELDPEELRELRIQIQGVVSSVAATLFSLYCTFNSTETPRPEA